MIKRTLATVLIILTVLPAIALAGSVLFAPVTDFERFDAALESSINAALGEGNAEANKLAPLSENGRHIVKFKDGISLSLIENALTGTEYRQLAESGERLFAISDTAGEFIKKHEAIIDYSEPDLVRETFAVTNDPATMPAYEKTGIYETWDIIKGKSDVIVAVLDTGVDRTHEDLAGANILPGYDAVTKTAGVYSDPVGHGTGVVGIIAATADNGIGIAGAAHGVTVLPIKVSSSSTTIYSSDLVSAIRFAANAGAKVINMSVGGLSYSYAEQEAVDYAVSKGCILVSASGNGGYLPYADKKSYPASYEGVISVASCTPDGERSVFSQYNDMVDVAAPGEAVTMPIVENGVSAYHTDSGTSYSCAIVSAIAALLVSGIDSNARFNGDEFLALIIDACGTKRSDELGYGIISARPMAEAVNLPIITGVTDGGVYNESINVGFNRGSAMLDGEPFEDGDAIMANGRHVLTVTDGENERTVGFRLDYDPLSYTFKEFSDYAYFEFNRGSALLDGFPYLSGSKITSPGRHEFLLTDGSESLRETVVIQYTLPSVFGVEDGGVYDHPIEICVVGDGKAMLDGRETENRIAVAESGVHTLTVVSGNGAVSKTYTFEINFPHAQITNTDYAEAHAAIDEENGYICVYGESLVGVRIYGIDDMSQYLHFLPIGTVYAHYFTETELLLAGENGITIIDRKGALDPENTPVTTVHSEGMLLYTFADDKIYCFDEQNIYLFDVSLSHTEVTHIARLGFECEQAFYSNGQLCLIAPSNDRLIRIFDIESNRLSAFSTELPLETLPLYFGEGYLAAGNRLIDVSNGNTKLEFGSHRVIGIEDGTLFCENVIIDIASGKETGRFPFTVSDMVKGENTIYLFGIEPILAKISNEAEGIYAYGAATPTDLAFSLPQTSNGFRQTLFIDDIYTAISAVASEERVFAIFKDRYAIYSLSLDGLTENAPIALMYEPDKLYLSGGYLTVSFANVPFIYVAPETDISLGVYVELPTKCVAACTVNGTLYTVSGGRLVYCNADGSGNTVISVRATNVATDGTRIYILNGTRLSAYSDELVLFAETETNGGELLVANGVIVGGKVYDAALFAEYTVISSPISYAYGNVYFSGNGIYDILSSRFIGNLGIADPDVICASPSEKIIAFGGAYITVSKYADAGDNLSTPIIDGISEGGIYRGGVTVTFNDGIGHVDGEVIESGREITKAGVHVFVLSLPFGQSITVNFTVEANIESIEFLVPNRTMSVGETITLGVRFLPEGASSVPVTYSCDSDGLIFGEMGEVTAIRTGVYTVTATVETEYETFIAQNTITVRDDLITFDESSGLRIDRDKLLLFGIEPGSDADDILKLLASNKEAKFLDADRREVTGVIATGHVLSIYGKDGTVTDSLTVVVRGDTDGDGYITSYDMYVLERILRNYHYSAEFLAAGDVNGNGVLADNDFRELRNIVLRRSDAQIGNPEENLFGSVTVQALSHIESGDIIDVAVCLNGLKYARGINGVIKYSEGLEFVESTVTGWDGDCRDIGDRKLGFFAYGEKGEECGKAFFVLINLRFRVTATAGERISVSAENVTASFESGAKTVRFEDGKFLVYDHGIGDFRIDIFNAYSFEFDPNVYEYDDITIPYNSALADIAVTRDKNSTVTVSGQVVPETGIATITVGLVTENGENKVYTLHVRRESEPRFDSNCRLESLAIEGFKLIPGFDPNITEYSISVPFGTEKINLHCRAQNPTTQIVIGDTTLRGEQNTVTVTVSAPDGESLIYTVHVTVLPKQEESSAPIVDPLPQDDTQTPWGLIVIIAMAVITVMCAVFIIVKRRNKKEG